MVRPLTALALVVAATAPASAGVAQVSFVDVTDEAGLDFDPGPVRPLASARRDSDVLVPSWFGAGVAVGDYDDDGDLDLYLLANRLSENRLYRNDTADGRVRFTDVTPPALADTGLSRVAHFVDLDGDGDRDLVLVSDDLPEDGTVSRLFRGDGTGGFEDVTEGSGFAPLGYAKGGASVVDYDGDGRVDLYVTNWGSELNEGEAQLPGHNRLYRNLGGFRFEDVTEAVGLGVLARDSFTPVFAEMDGAPGLDLYVAVDHSRDAFYRWAGDGFVDATEQVGALHEASDMGVAPADYDDDGDLDLFTANVYRPGHPRVPGVNALYESRLSDDGELTFVDRAAALGIEDTAWAWGTEWVDVDGDADLDLVVVNGFLDFVELFPDVEDELALAPEALFLNDPSGFRRVDGTALDAEDDARALVAFDVDRDGDRDLLYTRLVQGPRLLLNDTPGARRTVALALEPPALALGATVRGRVGAVTKRRDVLPGRSYLVGAPPEVAFGLGDAGALEDVVVSWVDGVETRHGDVPVGALLRLRRCASDLDCPGVCGGAGVCEEAQDPPDPPDASGGGGCAVGHRTGSPVVAAALLALLALGRRRGRG